MNKFLVISSVSLFGAFACYLGFWFVIVYLIFQIRLDFHSLLLAATVGAIERDHIMITLGALVLLFLSGLMIFSLFSQFVSTEERVLRGQKLISTAQLSRMARKGCKKSPQISLGGIPFPDDSHGRHSLIVGPTGTGKTTAFHGLIQGIQARDERMIVLDPNGDYFSRYGRGSDILINPFDKRSAKWEPFNDIRTELDADAMAQALIPPKKGQNDDWPSYARPFLAHCITTCQQKGEGRLEALFQLLLSPASELKRFLESNHLIGYFDEGAARALGSVLFTIGTHLQMFRHVYSGGYSLKTWVAQGKGNLYLTWRADQLPVLSPFFTAILEVVLRSLMSSSQKRPTWLLIDELGQLGQLASLKDTVTFGRGQGVRVVVGLQSNSQLVATYGPDDAKTILANLSNTLILGSAHHDYEQAKLLADAFGQIEILAKQYTNPTSGSGVGSVTSVRRWEPVVRPEEISSLAVGQAFLKLAGSLPAARVTIPNIQPKVIRRAFVSGVQGQEIC